jgi:hypothetical protein
VPYSIFQIMDCTCYTYRCCMAKLSYTAESEPRKHLPCTKNGAWHRIEYFNTLYMYPSGVRIFEYLILCKKYYLYIFLCNKKFYWPKLTPTCRITTHYIRKPKMIIQILLLITLMSFVFVVTLILPSSMSKSILQNLTNPLPSVHSFTPKSEKIKLLFLFNGIYSGESTTVKI